MNKTPLIVVGVIFLLLGGWGLMGGIFTPGDGRCSGAHVDGHFAVSEGNGTVSIEYLGGEHLEANKTFVAGDSRVWLWEELEPTPRTGEIRAGSNVTVDGVERVRILYQRPTPNWESLAPLSEPCYTTRNQTLLNQSL